MFNFIKNNPTKLLCKLALVFATVYSAQSQAITIEYLEQKCNAGENEVCVSLANQFYQANQATPQNHLFMGALKYSKQACDNDAKTCMLYGKIFEEAYVMNLDVSSLLTQNSMEAEIAHIYQRAIDSKALTKEDEGLAYLKLGNIGIVNKTYKDAKENYIKSCDLNNTEGCISSANCFYQGLGTEVDTNKGKKFAQKACDLGNEEGCIIVKEGKAYFEY